MKVAELRAAVDAIPEKWDHLQVKFTTIVDSTPHGIQKLVVQREIDEEYMQEQIAEYEERFLKSRGFVHSSVCERNRYHLRAETSQMPTFQQKSASTERERHHCERQLNAWRSSLASHLERQQGESDV